MNFADWPLAARLGVLFVAGLVLGGPVNWAIYWLAYDRRAISPWSPAPAGVAGRRLRDRLPIFGWWSLGREASVHGAGFWVRPLVVEILCGALLAALYWWEVDQRGLLPETLTSFVDLPGNTSLARDVQTALNWQFVAHAALLLFGLAATFIDFDERTIPDAITIPGTLVGLALLMSVPIATLPIMVDAAGTRLIGGEFRLAPLTPFSPNAWPWPGESQGQPAMTSLAIAMGCWWLWCVGLMPRVLRLSRGVRTAARLFMGRLASQPLTRFLLALGLIGSVAIWATWRLVGGEHWQGMFSSLVGIAVGGFIAWSVRNVATLAMGREAMGFGDVTMMSMIGAYLGWQPCVFVFFLAGLAGLVFAVFMLVRYRAAELWFGPALYLGAIMTILRWELVWRVSEDRFAVGWLWPAALGVALLLFAPLLWLVRGVSVLAQRLAGGRCSQ